jgi:hypothetical protein
MAGNIKMTRLGDILREKGLISTDQLVSAIAEQQCRRQGILASDKNAMDATSIGEILIDMGYITRQQLKRGLNWQMYLRKMTLVMSFCAPLMTMASGGVTAQTTQTSSSSVRTDPISLLIQAEDYSSMLGIQTETTKDVGAGLDVGYIDEGDWMKYDSNIINVPVASTYKVVFRVASSVGGGSFSIGESDGSAQYDVVTVPKTGGWQRWVDVERTITLPAGQHKLSLNVITKGFNINWFKIDFKGAALPISIQAKDYAAMSGIQLETTTDVGGGQSVGYIDAGDWMSYENIVIDIPATGNYKVSYRVASKAGGGSFEFHEADGSAKYDLVTVPKTSGWQNWVTVERVVTLTQGVHMFGVTVVTKGFNINWFKIEPAPSGSVVSGVTSSAASSSVAASVVSSQSSSAPAVVSSSSKSSIAMSSSSSSSAPAVELPDEVAGTVSLSWPIPSLREDRSSLNQNDLGGYEVRYRRSSEDTYTYISLEGATNNYYEFSMLEGSYVFEVAAFDINGLYSRFMVVHPRS